MSRFRDELADFREFILVPASVIIGIFALMAVSVYVVILTSRNLAETECGEFAKQSGRTTKFVDYTWQSWGCLTPAANGVWIDVNNLREVNS